MENKNEYLKWYRNTPLGRAKNLLKQYQNSDIRYGRGIGDLTDKWIVENIFTKPCVHCCFKCNSRLIGDEMIISRGSKVYRCTLNDEIIDEFPSIREAARKLNLNYSHINECCKGGFYDKRKNKWVNVIQYKGFKWYYKDEYEKMLEKELES